LPFALARFAQQKRQIILKGSAPKSIMDL
jgi:hypothetical protein